MQSMEQQKTYNCWIFPLMNPYEPKRKCVLYTKSKLVLQTVVYLPQYGFQLPGLPPEQKRKQF